ncbi:cytochrome P450 [Laetiporus sulphureus 93-53]|uniref:Cytochrome P450 n=1 Tax=Laetiporus sulphureus 93-53 TaxID=1314785 RepID=A0A165BIE6_9APHY|nr:cytochrome P450 [Laetiporus sulphureus 93-53]KZT01116.1 cytochrome P450 [Laetiporus sulphureus 93-53]
MYQPSAAVASLLLLLVVIVVYRFSSPRLPLPPGPKSTFWAGNVHQLPASEPWLTYAKWAQQYGPLVYFRIYGRRMLILNSLQAALDLLDTRSAIYSDRPMMWMYKELAGRKLAVFNISVNHPRFKKYRKLLQAGLNPRAIQSYRPIQEEEMHTLLRGLAKSPENFISHIRRNAGAVILKVAYGWTVAENNDYFVSLMEESFKLHALVVKPGRWLVDTYPILRFVPAWFPFADFKRQGAKFREEFSRIDTIPHNWAKQQIESGKYVESFTSLNLRPEGGTTPDAEEEDIVKWCSSALYAGGADTVVGLLTAFILLMVLNAEAQKRAQMEITRVVGAGRLPTVDDQESLPYVGALIKEVMRWAPVAPLALPHRVTEDNAYQGYWIPKGTVAHANVWAIAHDLETYPDPFAFKPERFLAEEGSEPQLDPRKFVFGFGRRVCPGSHFAESSAFLVISCILATFDISKSVDENGREVEPPVAFTSTVTSHVKPFPCRITVRAPELLATVASG